MLSWKALLEVSQGYLDLFLKLIQKIPGKDWEGKWRFQGLSGPLSKNPPVWLSDKSLQSGVEMSESYEDGRSFTVA